MKPTCKKLSEMIRDEKSGNKEYKKYHLFRLAKDENRHKKFLLKLKKKECK